MYPNVLCYFVERLVIYIYNELVWFGAATPPPKRWRIFSIILLYAGGIWMLIFLTICARSIVLVYAGLLDSMLAFTRPHRNQLHQPPSDHINGEKNKSLFLLGRLASNLHKIPPPPVCRLVREPNCRTVRHLRQLRQCYHRRWLATLSS